MYNSVNLIDSLVSIRPKKITFKEPIIYWFITSNKKEIQQEFPAPYYDVKNGKAKAIYGNYIEELIKIKKNTSLKYF